MGSFTVHTPRPHRLIEVTLQQHGNSLLSALHWDGKGLPPQPALHHQTGLPAIKNQYNISIHCDNTTLHSYGDAEIVTAILESLIYSDIRIYLHYPTL